MIDYQIKIEEQKDLNRKHIANAVLERHTSNPPMHLCLSIVVSSQWELWERKPC